MVDRIQRSTRWFCGEMRKKLRENEHKGGWDDCTHEYLMERLEEEVGELLTALKCYQLGDLNKSSVVSEAADVANFCMMIAERFKTKNI